MTATILNLQARQLLQRFTSIWDPRVELMEPWTQGGMAYATNRHWVVRIPANGLGNLAPWQKAIHPETIPLFDAAPFDRLAPMQAFEAPTLCTECNGTGRVTLAPCRHCDGKGFLVAHSNFECEACDGTGLEPIPYDATSKLQSDRCHPCQGTTWLFHRAQAVAYGKQWFMPGYLQVISELPGVQFATNPNPTKPAAFSWTGGQGLLMPCHAPTKDVHTTSKGVH